MPPRTPDRLPSAFRKRFSAESALFLKVKEATRRGRDNGGGGAGDARRRAGARRGGGSKEATHRLFFSTRWRNASTSVRRPRRGGRGGRSWCRRSTAQNIGLAGDWRTYQAGMLSLHAMCGRGVWLLEGRRTEWRRGGGGDPCALLRSYHQRSMPPRLIGLTGDLCGVSGDRFVRHRPLRGASGCQHP